MKNTKKSYFLPKTKVGMWSVVLSTIFCISVITAIILVNIAGILSYDDHWWDVTVAVLVPMILISLVLGIISVKKNKEKSILVYISVTIGILSILFGLLHSLFISD